MPLPFNLATTLRFAEQGDIETWVHTYLTTGAWANHAFAQGLRRQQRWWRGPLKCALAHLEHCCGPEPHMEYRTDPTDWEQRITALAASFRDVRTIPPLIVEYRSNGLVISDGNHRYAAMQRKGWTVCWVILWYSSQADYARDALRWQPLAPP